VITSATTSVAKNFAEIFFSKKSREIFLILCQCHRMSTMSYNNMYNSKGGVKPRGSKTSKPKGFNPFSTPRYPSAFSLAVFPILVLLTFPLLVDSEISQGRNTRGLNVGFLQERGEEQGADSEIHAQGADSEIHTQGPGAYLLNISSKPQDRRGLSLLQDRIYDSQSDITSLEIAKAWTQKVLNNDYCTYMKRGGKVGP
jgi:hypothetical protein